MDQDNPMGNTGWNASTTTSGSGSTTPIAASSATDSGVCPHCGQSTDRSGLENFLGRLGITDEMVNNLKTQFNNVEIDEYLNTARDYLKNTGDKATSYAKENPGRVAAGVAALAVGAGLIYASVNRDK